MWWSRSNYAQKLLRSTTVYMFVRTFLCIYAKSLLLMARAANLLSLHFLLAFKYLSLHCFFNDIQCGSTERSGCTLTFTDVESVGPILLTVVFNSIHMHSGAWFQMHPWRNASDKVPGKWLCQHHLERLFHPAMLVIIFWLHCSYSRSQDNTVNLGQTPTVSDLFNFQSPLSASAGQKSMN